MKYGLKSRSGTENDMLFVKTETNTGPIGQVFYYIQVFEFLSFVLIKYTHYSKRGCMILSPFLTPKRWTNMYSSSILCAWEPKIVRLQYHFLFITFRPFALITRESASFHCRFMTIICIAKCRLTHLNLFKHDNKNIIWSYLYNHKE